MPRLLKQLELSGFKSFASKTVFDFSSGITAIVGPNGSGKSNVIDGIRWLLGEREAKNLRGAKSEDLIFAGTPKRPRLGQAQASLHFWNKDNFFPVDFEEITVSRQVSRDGANKYFLNKAEVRLKDIVDFFAQARLGTKGLVVITQGNSDVFIQATPEGRREMIEEMLGLREYQLKKSEAERRLRNTQINLDKVRALTEEILPHLRSLKRQTHRWERREALAEELAGLEDQYFGIERRELQQKFSEADRRIAEHKELLAGFGKEKAEAEANLKKVESSQPEERRELQAIKRETQALLEKRSGLEKELGRLEAQLEMAAKPAAHANVPRTGVLLELVKKIKTKLEIALDDPEKLSEAVNQILEDIEGALSGDEPAAPKKEGPSGEIEERFRNIRKDLEDLEREMVSLKDKEQNLEKNQEQFYSAFKQAVAGLEAAKDRLEKWESENQKLLFEKERLNLRREEWERQVRQAERSPEDFREPVRIPEDFEPVAAEKRILRLRGELASMGEIDEALVKEARETEERYEFLKKESEDLDKARADLKRLISDLNEKIGTEFGSALVRINEEFHKFFGLMFGGGQAKLTLEKPKPKPAAPPLEAGEMPETSPVPEGDGEGKEEEEAEEGVEIDIKLPRKRINSLDMLSGGERSLVGIAALFALISVSPPPFLVLDEVDAALDERNARRFAELLKEFAKETQFVLVTHNRATMEAADILYGVTMDEEGTSKVLSLKLGETVPMHEKGN